MLVFQTPLENFLAYLKPPEITFLITQYNYLVFSSPPIHFLTIQRLIYKTFGILENPIQFQTVEFGGPLQIMKARLYT